MSTELDLIHPVSAEELPPWTRATATAFLHDPYGERTERWIDLLRAGWDPDRAWGVRDRDRWVATLRTHPRTLSVPALGAAAAEITVDALTAVTVAATHRRRGLMSRLVRSALAAARERGDAVSALIAAQWPIYGRFGYAPSTLSASYALRRASPGSSCPGDPSQVRQVERDEFGRFAPEVFAEAGRRRPGQIGRDRAWWDGALGLSGAVPRETPAHNWLIHESAGAVDGLLAWTGAGEPSLIGPQQKVDVWLLSAASDAAYRNLWSYLSGIDGVDEVRLTQRPVDEPVRWMLEDGRSLVMTECIDFLWLRILDVPAALTARRYAIPGELIIRVHDEETGGFAGGTYRLGADGDTVECQRVDHDPDVELSCDALASLYLGGFRGRELRPAGLVAEHSPGALERLDLMFSTPLAPANPTWF